MRAVGGKISGAACTLVLLGVCAFAIPGADAQAPARPRFGENYALSSAGTPGRGRDVPGLAVDPANPNHIVEADANPANLQCDYHVSFDGGRTWSGGHLTIRDGGESPPFPTPACDQNFDSGGYAHFNTGVVFGSGQNVYITFSAHRGPFNRPESGTDGGAGDDAVVARSTDGGVTFQPAVVALPGGGPVQANLGLAGQGMRPQIAVQRGAAGGQDRLYVASWHCYVKVRASQSARGGCSGGGGERRILVARSDNGGSTWTTAVLASAASVRSGQAALEAGSTDEQAREPSQPVIGPDGAVYVAYRNRDITDGTTCPTNPAITSPAPGGLPASKAHCIVVARSTDQGQTWSQFSTGQPVSPATLSNPRLAIDPSTPAGVGTLYVVYQRPVGSDPSDISIQASTNRGQTWSAPVRVNDDAAGNIQTNPSVSVGPAGRVDVIWGDRRHSYPGGGALGDTYYARSTTGGASFQTNRRITDRTFNLDVGLANELGANLTPGFSWYGPVSLPLPDGGVLAAWTDSRGGNVDNGIQDIFLSRLDPSAPIAASKIATATAPGLSVMLSRLAYPGGTEALGDRGGEPATRIVVANADDTAGALAGAVLARARWGPLLLSPAGALPAAVRAEAARLRPAGGYLIGDTSELSTQIGDEVGAVTRDGQNVARVAAPANVVTANQPAEVARRVAELMPPLAGTTAEAVIANPKTIDAVAGAALAAALRLPILFVDERTSAPPPTTAAISNLGIKKVLIVGGTTSVPAGVETQLTTLLGASNVKRVGGADQYETSEAVLAEARLRGLPPNVVYVADGTRPIDATVLGAAVGRLNGLMLLVPGGTTTAAESRLVALGIDGAVDRVVGAIGTGGTDPAVASAPAPPAAPPAPPPPPSTTAGSRVPLTAPSPAGCPRSRTPRNPIVLTNGADRRNGTALGDLILAGSGNDVVDALGGDDCVDLGPGNDRGQGGTGDDFVQGGTGNDRVLGGPGNDRLRGHRGKDRIEGAGGNDSLLGGPGNDTLAGGPGNDRLTGDSGRDRISGGTGRDTISARDGQRDRITCGSARDTVRADRIDAVARDCERISKR